MSYEGPYTKKRQTYANYYRKYYIRNRVKLLEYARLRREYVKNLKEKAKAAKELEEERLEALRKVKSRQTGGFTSL